MRLRKYQALGNDYLVVEAAELSAPLTPDRVRSICDRHFGVGSDGIILVERRSAESPHAIRILNPDGSEAEKSGNGLRIFARYLWDEGRVDDLPFLVDTPGGRVTCQVFRGGGEISVEMGKVTFESAEIPVAGPPRAVVGEEWVIAGRRLQISAASVGNPHCVVFGQGATRELALELGPILERHPSFPNRTNVQLLDVLDDHRIRIEIWERGAGYTYASGSSSCAAAAVAVRLGCCRSPVTVRMPGGELAIEISPSYEVRMRGPAQPVFSAEWPDANA